MKALSPDSTYKQHEQNRIYPQKQQLPLLMNKNRTKEMKWFWTTKCEKENGGAYEYHDGKNERIWAENDP